MPVTMTTKSSATQFRVGSLGAGWQPLGEECTASWGSLFYRKPTPGGSPGQRNWSGGWGVKGWGKSQDSPAEHGPWLRTGLSKQPVACV